jgi:uncharacterized membrane protein
MTTNLSPKTKSESIFGVIYAGSAFLIWGLSPVYWKALGAVSAMEIIMHRIVWSFIFLVCLIVLQRRWHEFLAALKDGRMLLTLFATAIFVSGNWLLYVWSVNNNCLLQASLGYYINPLVNVVLGMVFLRERLRKPQMLAVLLATRVSLDRAHTGADIRILRSDSQSGAGGIIGRSGGGDNAAFSSCRYISFLSRFPGCGWHIPCELQARLAFDRLCSAYGCATPVFHFGCQAAISFHRGFDAVYWSKRYVFSGCFFLWRTFFKGPGLDFHYDLVSPGHLFDRLGDLFSTRKMKAGYELRVPCCEARVTGCTLQISDHQLCCR